MKQFFVDLPTLSPVLPCLPDAASSRTSGIEQLAANRDALPRVGQTHALTKDLSKTADRDLLSSLPNETRLRSTVNGMLVKHRSVALMLINVDHFQAVNDGLGRNAGDALLVDIGRRLAAVTSDDTLASWLRADQFALVCWSDMADLDPLATADRVHGALAAPFTVDGRQWLFTCSVGIAAHCRADAHARPYKRVEELLHDADLAMVQARKEGRHRTVVFDASMRAAAMARLDLEADLQTALCRQEFELHLQPIVRLADGRIKAFEALARWQKPGHGPVPPSVFIPVLEETGLIIPFGHWLIRRACGILAAWQKHLQPGDCPVLGINLSVRQFDDPELFDIIQNAVETSGVIASNLRFEVTESRTIEDLDRGASLLRRLTGLGFSISLDDFGTGYSSLGYLRTLPVDGLKIDRSFVASMQDEGGSLRIVRAVLGLAASIGLSVVAEGIENEQQAALLKQLGCPLGQGYFFSPPVSFFKASKLLLKSRQHHPRNPAATPTNIDTDIAPPSQDEASPPVRPAARLARIRDGLRSPANYMPFLVIIGFMTLHAGLICFFPRIRNQLTGACLAVGPAIAAVICCWTGWRRQTVMRSKWTLTSVAFSLWSLGSICAVYAPTQSSAGPVDFLYFLSTVALLFAITAPIHDRQRPLFLVMDGFQALLGAILGFIVIFGKVPFSSELVRPMSEGAILWTYDTENLSLMFLSLLRLFGSNRSSDRCSYDQAILGYTLTFGPLCSLYNHFSPTSASIWDIMLDLPFFLMAILAARSAHRCDRHGKPSTSIAAFVDSIGPAFLTLAVLLAGSWIIQQRPLAGIVSILVAVTIYALRVSLLQVRYLVAHQQLLQTQQRMERLALEDGLTGVGNRHAYDAALKALWAEAEQAGTPLSALLIDVDHFKLYNDTYGHPAGDACLTRVATVLLEAGLRHGGQIARYGGEEFVVLLPNTCPPQAREIASHIRQTVAALDIVARDGISAPTTVSIGAATAFPPGTVEPLLLAMDDALYRAKRNGRDRIEFENVGRAVPRHVTLSS